jgi:hypothetical protein
METHISFPFRPSFQILKFASPAILYFVIFRDMLEAITYGPVSLSTPQSTW